MGAPMVPLSQATLERLHALFDPKDRESATKFLVEDCAENIPLWRPTTPEGLERIRFAALKISEGKLEALVDAIAEAQTDYRDALVWAGFADDVDAHLRWKP